MTVKAQSPPLCVGHYLTDEKRLVEVLGITATQVLVYDSVADAEFPITMKELAKWRSVYPLREVLA